MSTPPNKALIAAALAARALLVRDRKELFECHQEPDGVVRDELGLQALAEYDAVIAQISRAVAEAQGAMLL